MPSPVQDSFIELFNISNRFLKRVLSPYLGHKEMVGLID